MFSSCCHVLSIKRQRQWTITFWKEGSSPRRTYSFHNKGVCSVSVIAELSTSSRERSRETVYLFSVLLSYTYLSPFPWATGSWSNPKPYKVVWSEHIWHFHNFCLWEPRWMFLPGRICTAQCTAAVLTCDLSAICVWSKEWKFGNVKRRECQHPLCSISAKTDLS